MSTAIRRFSLAPRARTSLLRRFGGGAGGGLRGRALPHLRKLCTRCTLTPGCRLVTPRPCSRACLRARTVGLAVAAQMPPGEAGKIRGLRRPGQEGGGSL